MSSEVSIQIFCPFLIDLLLLGFPPIFTEVYFHCWASLVAQMVKHLSAVRETRVWSLGWEDPLGKEMAAHCSTLVWKIPWMEEPGRLQFLGSQRVGHDWVSGFTYFHCYLIVITPKGNPLPYFNSHSPFPYPPPLRTTNALSSLWICIFWTFHINGIIFFFLRLFKVRYYYRQQCYWEPLRRQALC